MGSALAATLKITAMLCLHPRKAFLFGATAVHYTGRGRTTCHKTSNPQGISNVFGIEIVPNWHPLVVHFAIALLLAATALFVVGTVVGLRSPRGTTLTVVARWNLGMGTLAALVALLTGWQAYNTVAHDDLGHANMVRHMYWAVGTATVFLAAAAGAWLDRCRTAGAGTVLLALLLLGAGALTVTGWLGGENVYRHGLGVMRMPNMAMPGDQVTMTGWRATPTVPRGPAQPRAAGA
ncbi:DUF2231 domain-containing protein [Paeniroseomonas aquatica]|uniref:DUF2231 domain-containing protein n=1 Tax=Paeniroseomonas aquatica TaxID=373043 RepID=UPI00360D7918